MSRHPVLSIERARDRAAREGKDLSTFVRDVVDQYLAAS